jgi:hypothetical protein
MGAMSRLSSATRSSRRCRHTSAKPLIVPGASTDLGRRSLNRGNPGPHRFGFRLGGGTYACTGRRRAKIDRADLPSSGTTSADENEYGSVTKTQAGRRDGVEPDSRWRPRLERHPLGPRLCARPTPPQWHLGLAILLLHGLGRALGFVHDVLPSLFAALGGLWLVAKDWRDISPARRDTAAWRLGLHRAPLPLRRFRPAEPLPVLAAAAAVAFGVVNLLSALTPNSAGAATCCSTSSRSRSCTSSMPLRSPRPPRSSSAPPRHAWETRSSEGQALPPQR